MDKFKNLSKGGWHPSGDRAIHRDSWKTDIKGMATGKKKDPYDDARNHESKPLNTLRDPASFGAPPKHSAYYGSEPSSPSVSAGPSGGLGSAVPAPAKRPTREEIEAAEEEANKPPPGPYRADTSGLRTDNLPKPPVRRADAGAGSPAPAPPPRAKPAVQQRAVGGPPPVLPPRGTEYPDEYTPAPPPPYGEATQVPPAQNPAMLNQGALNRLGQAGVSIPGLGIGHKNDSQATTQSPTNAQGHSGQLNELQQRFSRVGTNTASPQEQQAQSPAAAPWQQRQAPARTSSPGLPPRSPGGSTPPGSVAAAAANKKPPPPPPKKSTLTTGSGPAPPPIPMASKPKPY